MDWLATLGDLAINGASGGVLGLIGVGLQGWLKSGEERRKFEHDAKMREFDLKAMQYEHAFKMREIEATTKAQVAVAEQQREATEAEAEAEVQVASYQADRATYGGGFVDSIRGVMRPLITVYLLILMTAIAVQLAQVTVVPTPRDAWTQLSQIINEIVFLSVLTVTWWFGSRPVGRRV